MHISIHILIASALLMTPMTPALAQGFLQAKSDENAFCKLPSLRQTVVYIDDLDLITGQKEWADKLYNKLKATLTPGEKLTVVELSPRDGRSREIWSDCWPDYPADEKAKKAAEHPFFSESPMEQLRHQQSTFGIGFAGALSDIYDKHSHAPSMISPDSPQKKQILAALASDSTRYEQTKVTIRAIVYSDLAEDSSLGSIFHRLPSPPENFGKKLTTYFRHSVFYLYGADNDVEGTEVVRENTRGLWTNMLTTMNATIGGLGSDLTVPDSLPVSGIVYSVDVMENEQLLHGRLSVLADSDGTLVDSWIGIDRLSGAALTGSMHCDSGNICTINAMTSKGILSDSPTEALTLRGPTDGMLSGLIGVKGSDVMFKITANATAR